jgi:opacity protein-like surface antigen
MKVSLLDARIPTSMASQAKARLSGLVLLVATLTSGAAQADVGVQVGPHAGVALSGNLDPYVGVDVRLTAPSSPLTIQPTFDYVFDEHQTLYHIGGNLLYEVPVAFRLKPYVGVGMNYSTFVLNKPSGPSMINNEPTGDDEGHRLGLNLLAGVRLDLPWVSPFLQVTKGVGEFDAVAVGGGLELSVREGSGAPSAPEPMRFAVTPYLANNVVGDVQSGRIGAGVSLAFYPWELFGFELDGQLHGHFFRDRDVASLVPEGVDLDTSAALLSASAVARYCWGSPSYGAWCPYATAGAGVIRAWFDGRPQLPGTTSVTKAQTDPTLAAGVGITHLFTRHVGLRVDARYFRALVDDNAPDGGYFEDYGFLRFSAGVSVGF